MIYSILLSLTIGPWHLETLVDNQPEQESLTEQAVRLLRDDIMSVEFKPGQRLNIEALKQRYAMGGTPVREALNQLIGGNWVTVEPLKGFRVARLNGHQFAELLQIRQALVASCMAHAIDHLDDDWEAACVGAFYRWKKYTAKAVEETGQQLVEVVARYNQFVSTLCHLQKQSLMTNMILNVLQLTQWHSCIIFNRTQNTRLAMLDWPQNYQPIMDGVMLRQKQVVVDHWVTLNKDASNKVKKVWSEYL